MNESIPVNLQQSVLSLLLFNAKHCSQIRYTLPINTWSGDLGITILAKAAYEYFDAYKKPMGAVHAYDVIESLNTKPEIKDNLKQLVEWCEDNLEQLNVEHVINSIEKMHRESVLRKMLDDGAELLKYKEYDKIEAMAMEAVKQKLLLFNPGKKISTVIEEMLKRPDDYLERDQILLGIPELDNRGLVPTRKKLLVIAGAAKKGKSFFMIHAGRKAMLQGKKVIHITLEMPEDEVVMRYTQSLYALTLRKAQNAALTKQRIGLSNNGDIYSDIIPMPESIFNADSTVNKPKLYEISDKLKYDKLIDNNLWVKEFPNSSLTIDGLYAYLDNMEMQHNFTPDLLLLDYADLMKVNSKSAEDHRVMLGELYKQVRGIASERNIAVVTASQINREGGRSKKATEYDIAADFSKIATADMAFIYNQTEAEKEIGLARLYIAIARGAESGFELLLTQDYSTSQFCNECIELSKDKKKKLEEYLKNQEDGS